MSVACTADTERNDLPVSSLVSAAFFSRPSDEVAPDLIGKIVWRAGVGGGRLTEVEAYLPQDDPACHAARGQTRRNSAMFGAPGCLYLYLSYGIHVLLNLVCDRQSVGSAVLVRSFEPVGDTTVLARNRRIQRTAAGRCEAAVSGTSRDRLPLSCGPGRVGQALGLHLGLNGLPLGQASGVYVFDDGFVPEVTCSGRIGISQGLDLPLRFHMTGSDHVTRRVGPVRGRVP